MHFSPWFLSLAKIIHISNRKISWSSSSKWILFHLSSLFNYLLGMSFKVVKLCSKAAIQTMMIQIMQLYSLTKRTKRTDNFRHSEMQVINSIPTEWKTPELITASFLEPNFELGKNPCSKPIQIRSNLKVRETRIKIWTFSVGPQN